MIAFILFIVLSIPVAIYRGLTLSMLWAWFISPYFNLPELNIPIAIGISYIASLLTFHPRFDIKSESNDPTMVVICSSIFTLVMCSLFLLSGYVVSLFL